MSRSGNRTPEFRRPPSEVWDESDARTVVSEPNYYNPNREAELQAQLSKLMAMMRGNSNLSKKALSEHNSRCDPDETKSNCSGRSARSTRSKQNAPSECGSARSTRSKQNAPSECGSARSHRSKHSNRAIVPYSATPHQLATIHEERSNSEIIGRHPDGEIALLHRGPTAAVSKYRTTTKKGDIRETTKIIITGSAEIEIGPDKVRVHHIRST